MKSKYMSLKIFNLILFCLILIITPINMHAEEIWKSFAKGTIGIISVIGSFYLSIKLGEYVAKKRFESECPEIIKKCRTIIQEQEKISDFLYQYPKTGLAATVTLEKDSNNNINIHSLKGSLSLTISSLMTEELKKKIIGTGLYSYDPPLYYLHYGLYQLSQRIFLNKNKSKLTDTLRILSDYQFTRLYFENNLKDDNDSSKIYRSICWEHDFETGSYNQVLANAHQELKSLESTICATH